MKRLRIALWVVAALAAAIFGYFSLRAVTEQGGYSGLIDGRFSLPATSGGEVSSETLKGKPYAVFFGFTHCPVVCPTTMNDLSLALAALGEEGRQFQVFFITVDPERDELAMLKDFLGSFDANVVGLRPELAALPGLAKQFRVIYEKVPTSDGSYTMNHTASIFLFDRKGQFAGTIAFDEKPEVRVAKLRRLIAGS